MSNTVKRCARPTMACDQCREQFVPATRKAYLRGLCPKCHGLRVDQFCHGVLAALAIVALHDHGTCYEEIVSSVGKTDLLRVAKSDEGTAVWSGLVKYGYCKKPKGKE